MVALQGLQNISERKENEEISECTRQMVLVKMRYYS